MIKANELRIGNYVGKNSWPEHLIVSRNNNAYITVSDLDGHQSFFRVDSFKPIPLTEKWLLDFGFVQNGCQWEDVTTNWYFMVLEEDSKFFYSFSLLQIQYVHQLQNLYFALTGEELTLKP